ncbi:MAG TPA: amidohydrolase family protein [Candidatus Dormibacteraeota bacterium]|nr:amidohydrolase family protein [Candidatus Dormibacteraeota bacterium]
MTVDADGHVLEPRDTWLRYLEPNLRDRAIRIERDGEGVENLLVDGRPHAALRGRLGALGGIGMESADLMTVGRRSYEEGCPPGGYDPHARLAVMDSEKIDVVLLYPTIGIAWEGLVQDPRLATAYARAYNRWIVDFCAADRRRLVPIAHICLLDPEGAVVEVERARHAGCAGVYLSPDPASRGGLQFDAPSLAPFWAKVQDLDMPVAFHVVARGRNTLAEWYGKNDEPVGTVIFGFVFLALDVMAAFTAMMTRGLLETYPRLKLAVLEAGSNWITAWLDRLDHKAEVMRPFSSLKLLPSEYFKRQCVISAEPDESLTGPVVEHLGADYVVWASDYPHLDASFHVVDTIRERIAGLPEDARRKVLGGNALRFYHLAA